MVSGAWKGVVKVVVMPLLWTHVVVKVKLHDDQSGDVVVVLFTDSVFFQCNNFFFVAINVTVVMIHILRTTFAAANAIVGCLSIKGVHEDDSCHL